MLSGIHCGSWNIPQQMKGQHFLCVYMCVCVYISWVVKNITLVCKSWSKMFEKYRFNLMRGYPGWPSFTLGWRRNLKILKPAGKGMNWVGDGLFLQLSHSLHFVIVCSPLVLRTIQVVGRFWGVLGLRSHFLLVTRLDALSHCGILSGPWCVASSS
jgi:hypothetical protein